MLRDLTIWVYSTALVVSATLSDSPAAFRAGLLVVWGFVSLGAGVWRVMAAARMARGRARSIAGLCAICAYPLHSSMRHCPECGQQAGVLPDGEVTLPGGRGRLA